MKPVISIKMKFGILFMIISFHAIPSSMANKFDQFRIEQPVKNMQDAANEYNERINEIKQIEKMESAFSQKITNGLQLLKKGDRSGGCRDLFIAIDLGNKIETREMLYSVKYTMSAKSEILQSEAKATRKRLLDLIKPVYSQDCR